MCVGMGTWERVGFAACVVIGMALGQTRQNKSVVPIRVARRVALVIGNSNYQHIQGVPPASNDADDMAATLRHLGFDSVTVKKDLKADELIEETGRFSRAEVQP